MSNEHVLGFRLPFFATFLGLFKQFTHLCRKVLKSRFTHFFCNFFVTEKHTLQTFLLLECMTLGWVILTLVYCILCSCIIWQISYVVISRQCHSILNQTARSLLWQQNGFLMLWYDRRFPYDLLYSPDCIFQNKALVGRMLGLGRPTIYLSFSNVKNVFVWIAKCICLKRQNCGRWDKCWIGKTRHLFAFPFSTVTHRADSLSDVLNSGPRHIRSGTRTRMISFG